MEKKSDILEKIGHRDGMTVPEGYFADFAARMAQSLPEKAAVAPEKPSMWLRLRPFVYMAAMFAGIWCMMKMFNMMGGQSVDLSDINNHPGVITALSDDDFFNHYVMPDVDEYDMLDDLYESGLSVDEIFTDDSDTAIN